MHEFGLVLEFPTGQTSGTDVSWRLLFPRARQVQESRERYYHGKEALCECFLGALGGARNLTKSICASQSTQQWKQVLPGRGTLPPTRLGEIRVLLPPPSAPPAVCSLLTWLWTVVSWLLKVMVRLVDVLGATCVMKGVLLWFTVSYIFTRRLQISMFWKHDLTLFMRKAETETQENRVRWDEGENMINPVNKTISGTSL